MRANQRVKSLNYRGIELKSRLSVYFISTQEFTTKKLRVDKLFVTQSEMHPKESGSGCKRFDEVAVDFRIPFGWRIHNEKSPGSH